jgi:predicted TIM-barrel fold metal-dependent hydrolase
MRNSCISMPQAHEGRGGLAMAHRDCPHCERASRRDVLARLGAAGAAALLPQANARAQVPVASGKGRIDVHYHIFPPESLAVSRNPAQSGWTVQQALDALDRNGVATAIASAGSTLPVDKARAFNEFGARIGRDHAGRFGLFAALPLPDIDASLKEIAHAYDVLKADGIGLATSYGDLWLGDRRFEPVLEELNRRKAVVFVHPADAPCCVNLSYQAPPVGGSWIEWPMHSARTMLSLLLGKVTQRLPDIRFIFAHDGGTMIALVGRIAGFAQNRRPDFQAKFRDLFPNGVEAEYRKFHFDIAQGTYPVNFEAMRKLVPDTHILFGSDYPYFPIAAAAEGLRRLDLPPALLPAIERGNAEALLPRWKA